MKIKVDGGEVSGMKESLCTRDGRESGNQAAIR